MISLSIKTLAERFQTTPAQALLALTSNAAPSQALPVICNTRPREITISTWGFVLEWAGGRADVKPLINARTEPVATKPIFRQAFKSKRCLVFADGFDEWKRVGKRKVPYRMTLKHGEPCAFAGLWSAVHDPLGQPYTTFAIITMEANALVAHVHNRMPVILHACDEACWLDTRVTLKDVQALLVPYPAELLTLAEVSSKVNSPAYNTPDLL